MDKRKPKRFDLGRARQRAAGARGLLAAIIAQAYRDYVVGNEEQRQDAAAYFQSDLYKHHLNLLRLPSDILPELVDAAELAQMATAGD